MGQRVVTNPKELAKSGGFGKQEGIARVEDARIIAVQLQKGEKNGGGLITPFLALQLDEVYVDTNLKPIDDSAVELHNVIVCWGDSKTLEGKFRFQPANADGPDDASPVDVGVSDVEGDDKFKMVEIGAEGNCLVSTDGAVPFENSDFGVFIIQLEKKGFKADILTRGYAPDYKGLVYEFKTSLKSDVFKKLGMNYSAPKTPRKDNKGNELPDTCREVTQILVRPYEVQNTAKGKGVVKGATAAEVKAKGAEAKAGAASSAANGSGDTGTIDAAMTKAIGAIKGKEFASLSKFIPALAVGPNGLIKSLGMAGSNSYTNNLKKLGEDELAALGMEFGFEVEGGKISVTAE